MGRAERKWKERDRLGRRLAPAAALGGVDLRTFTTPQLHHPVHRPHATMICRRCLLRFGRQTGQRIASRALSTTDSLPAQTITAQTTTATDPQPNGLPTATSTSIAQPFSSPDTYTDLPTQSHQSKKPVVVPSSVPAGTVLKGLNFMKNKPDPVAMEDNEYPAWLWTVLAKSEESGSMDSAEGDLFGMAFWFKSTRLVTNSFIQQNRRSNVG